MGTKAITVNPFMLGSEYQIITAINELLLESISSIAQCTAEI